MKSQYVYIRTGYSDGFILLKFSDVNDQTRSSKYIYEKFYKNFKIQLFLNDGNLELKQASILHRSRECIIDMKDLNREEFLVSILWNRHVTYLTVISSNRIRWNVAKDTDFNTLIDEKGAITYLNSRVGSTDEFRMISHGADFTEDRIIDEPDALVNWKDNLITIEILLNDSRKCSHVTKMEIYKACIFLLVKGFEIFLKKRFVELGYYLRPNYDQLVTFYKKHERSRIKDIISESLLSGHRNIVPYLFTQHPNSISFQEYSTVSNIYRKVLSIDITQISMI